MNFKNTMTELVHLSKAAKILGLSSQALRNWDNTGKIKTVRSAGGHRRIPMSEINRLLGKSPDHARTTTLVYARCSTTKQTENLDRQVGRLLEFCLKNKWTPELHKEIGSGLNENRKELHRLLKRISDKDVKRVLLEYKDRLTRFGFSIFEKHCQAFGVEVVVIEDKVDIPFEQELANDMVSLITSFSARMYGRRGGRKKK